MTGEQFLIPPFELNFVVSEYECECASCRVSKSKKNLVKKFFLLGFLCPLFWIANLVLICYCQLYLSHEPRPPKFSEEELPTLYQRDLEYERCQVKLSENVLEDMESLTKTSDGQVLSESVSKPDSNCLNTLGGESNKQELSHTKEELARFRYNFLKEACTNIVNSHNELRHYYQTYALRSLLGILGGVVVSLFIVLVCKSSNGSPVVLRRIFN